MKHKFKCLLIGATLLVPTIATAEISPMLYYMMNQTEQSLQRSTDQLNQRFENQRLQSEIEELKRKQSANSYDMRVDDEMIWRLYMMQQQGRRK